LIAKVQERDGSRTTTVEVLKHLYTTTGSTSDPVQAQLPSGPHTYNDRRRSIEYQSTNKLFKMQLTTLTPNKILVCLYLPFTAETQRPLRDPAQVATRTRRLRHPSSPPNRYGIDRQQRRSSDGGCNVTSLPATKPTDYNRSDQLRTDQRGQTCSDLMILVGGRAGLGVQMLGRGGLCGLRR